MTDFIHTLPLGRAAIHVLHDGAAGDWHRNVLLVRYPEGNVLIDTGNGDVEPCGFLPERLEALHLQPSDISMVILSHADWDHIGGAVDRNGDPAFPKARYVLPRKEAEFWAGRPERVRLDTDIDLDFRRLTNVLPVQRLAQLGRRLELVDLPAQPWPGITLRFLPGHTPGYSTVEIEDSGERLWSVGDMIFDTEALADPEWAAPFDLDVNQVRASRADLLGQAADSGVLLAGYHLEFPGLGTVTRQGPGFLWTTQQ